MMQRRIDDPAAVSQQAASTVSVVATTVLVTRAESRRRLEAGFQACLVKPFSVEELVETMVTFAHN
jgi:CheY-like chemotaxis protein